MFKFAFAAGIAFEWLFGAAVESVAGFGFAALRAVTAGLLAWMVLEAAHLLIRAVMTLDDRV
ncbi:MAG: hypothetical protein ACK4V1_08170 [Burkholderiaceae bacterium]